MAKNRNIFLVVLVLIPAAIHFLLLNKFLINFPSWGDDIIYLDLIEKFDKISWPERLTNIFAFHNYIHRLAFSRTLLILYAKIAGNIDFKVIIMLANLQWIAILGVIFKYLKREKLSIWYLVGISILLFSVNGNLDNYGLIGVLQHLSSILFMVLISYGLVYKPNHFWPLFMTLLYPFVTTEGLVFTLLVLCYVYFTKSKFRVIFSILMVFLFVFYFHNYEGDHSNISKTDFFEKIYLFVKGILVYLGSSLKHNVSIAWIIGLFILVYCANFLWQTVSEKSTSKPSARLFPLFLFVQTLMTGALIAIGRVSNGGEAALQVLLADRFYTYGAFLLVILYLMVLVDLRDKAFMKPVYGLIPAVLFGIFSFSNAQKRLYDLKNRVQLDASNAFLFKKSANYILNSHDSYLLSNAGLYDFPSEINDLTIAKLNRLKILGGQKLTLKKQDQIDPQIGQYKILNLSVFEKSSVGNVVYLESERNPMGGILIPIVQINQGRDHIIKVHVNGFDYTKPFAAYLINLNLTL
jgi:hypothetical protein